jgi:hypothetical protein
VAGHVLICVVALEYCVAVAGERADLMVVGWIRPKPGVEPDHVQALLQARFRADHVERAKPLAVRDDARAQGFGRAVAGFPTLMLLFQH